MKLLNKTWTTEKIPFQTFKETLWRVAPRYAVIWYGLGISLLWFSICSGFMYYTLLISPEWLHCHWGKFTRETTLNNKAWTVCILFGINSISNTINTLRPRQNSRLFPDDVFKCIFLNETVCIAKKISLKFVLKIRINSIPALAPSHYLNQWCYIYWGIYASPGFNE